MTNPTEIEDRVKEAVRNEWGSRLCKMDWHLHRPCDSGAVCACLDVARAALAAMPEPWRPIAEAPKGKDYMIDVWCVPPDGVDFKLERGGIRLTDVFWYVADEISPHTGWARITDDGGLDFIEMPPISQYGLPAWKPTHFRPLPAPPKEPV